MQIVVALNGSRERNLTLSPGDDVSINLVVYANDGDANPVAVTDAQISTGGGGYLPIGTKFAIPYGMGRTPYRIIGKVAGVSSTLVTGIIEAAGPGKLYWGYWSGDNIFPPVITTAQAANVVVSDSAGNFQRRNVEDVLEELADRGSNLQEQIDEVASSGGVGGIYFHQINTSPKYITAGVGQNILQIQTSTVPDIYITAPSGSYFIPSHESGLNTINVYVS